ncbi:Site-specific DNA recombinase [Fulvimarina manganoxydans]|uniref:Site-specific DNA recombinase n=1 Tax=Fulvimarina manganoxydans TaxID=937218 RepID=A0A1W2ARY3_9HYPH|nr:recombinase family protein [Fulvimarina manganoxydans]SMC62958.1 Site-specific DNA recombinase [Fulvimarina manganoxydans]
MLARLYLRASTQDQDAGRAQAELETFAAERGLTIAGTFVENESGARLARPELFRLLKDSRPGDVLLVEQVDRLSRLTTGDWNKLRAEIAAKGVRVVALDLPTSYMLADPDKESFTARMAEAINGMLLDMLAAVARKDYEDRRRRQAQGIAKAKDEGRYRGRPANKKRNEGIAQMLANRMSYTAIQNATGASRATIARISKRGNSNDQALPT